MVAEQIHRYPRWITWLIELLSTLAVGIALVRFARDLLMLLWTTVGIDTTLLGRVPYRPRPAGAGRRPERAAARARLAGAGAAAGAAAAQ